jgi:hypothetical protein
VFIIFDPAKLYAGDYKMLEHYVSI